MRSYEKAFASIYYINQSHLVVEIMANLLCVHVYSHSLNAFRHDRSIVMQQITPLKATRRSRFVTNVPAGVSPAPFSTFKQWIRQRVS